MKTNELYLMEVPMGYSQYFRPCLVIEIGPMLATIAPISSAMDLYIATRDFLLAESHPDFATTGLLRTSFVHGGKFFHKPLVKFTKKPMGMLTGEMAKDFDKWLGRK